MSKILYLQCNMGAAGDMLNAALFGLLPYEDKAEYLSVLNDNDLGIHVIMSEVKKCGIQGNHMTVEVDGEVEHVHDHEHEHTHHHVSLSDVEGMIDSFDVSQAVKEKSKTVYRMIASAESRAHNTEVSAIHFHEVGMKDAIADVVGTCLLLEKIAPDKIIVSDINVGFGNVKCAHGILPVPAPATAFILEGAPIYQGNTEGEMCTPTGAALLMSMKDDFGKMPAMKVMKTGYGMGNKEFAQLNCVRAFLGECDADSQPDYDEKIVEISCNIDDMTGEEIGYACEALLAAGALDVYTQSIYMKKNRPGVKLVCITKPEDESALSEMILKNTTTWGVRSQVMNRRCLKTSFETVETPHGSVRVKIGEGYGIRKSKPEYEDVAAIAKNSNISITFGRGICN